MSDDQIDSKGYRDNATPNQVDGALPSKYTGPKPVIPQAQMQNRFYNMDHEERGKALVINNIVFDNRIFNRKGQDTDATSIYQRFQDLEFDTELLNDASKEEIFKKLKEISDEDHSNYDCFACAILTHGDGDGLWARDKVINIKDLMSLFNATNCPSLATKPKLFFIQASQGSDYDRGQDLNVSDAPGPDYSEYTPTPIKPMKIPKDSDFLLVYSSTPGNASSTNNEQGSIFINTLSDELNHFDPDEDFYRLLTRVCNRVAKYEYKGDDSAFIGKKQMPCFVSMLTKSIKFGTK